MPVQLFWTAHGINIQHSCIGSGWESSPIQPFLHPCVLGVLNCPWSSAPGSSSSAPCFPDGEPELHPVPTVHGVYTDLVLFGGLVCIPSSIILLVFLISAEHQDGISRHFSVITSKSFLCVVTVNSEVTHVPKIRLVYSHHSTLQISTLILMAFYCPVILIYKILLISSW